MSNINNVAVYDPETKTVSIPELVAYSSNQATHFTESRRAVDVFNENVYDDDNSRH